MKSNCLKPHGLQHSRLPCPSPAPRACSNSGPSSQWCHPTISSSVVPFPASIFPAIRVFPVSQYWSFSFSINPSNEYSGLISLRIYWLYLLVFQRTLKSLLQAQFKSINSLVLSFLFGSNLTSIHDYWKNHSFDYADLCQQSNVGFLIWCIGLS